MYCTALTCPSAAHAIMSSWLMVTISKHFKYGRYPITNYKLCIFICDIEMHMTRFYIPRWHIQSFSALVPGFNGMHQFGLWNIPMQPGPFNQPPPAPPQSQASTSTTPTTTTQPSTTTPGSVPSSTQEQVSSFIVASYSVINIRHALYRTLKYQLLVFQNNMKLFEKF